MNAGPDVERLISGWLHEEAPGRAPDRILDAAGRTIDRTHQRRLGAAWRESMSGMRGLAAAAVIGGLVVAGALYAFRPGLGPGSQSTPRPTSQSTSVPTVVPSPTPSPPTAGPLQIGTYFGPILQVADLVADMNADTTLTQADRDAILDDIWGIRGKTTFQISIQFYDGVMTEREIIDDATILGSFGTYVFVDDHTLVYTETIGGDHVATVFELTIDGDSFTLHRTTGGYGAADDFVVDRIFESGPFVLR